MQRNQISALVAAMFASAGVLVAGPHTRTTSSIAATRTTR